MASTPRQITSADFFFCFLCLPNSSISHLDFYCIKQIDYIFPCVCTVIDHRRRHSVCKEQQSHNSTSSCVVRFCSLHALTSSVIYYRTHTSLLKPQLSLGIHVFIVSLEKTHKNTMTYLKEKNSNLSPKPLMVYGIFTLSPTLLHLAFLL